MNILFVAMRESLKESWDFDTVICFSWDAALGLELYHGPKHKKN